MKISGKYLPVFVIVFAMLIPTNPVFGKKGYAIKGFVGNSPTQAAPNTTVELLDGNTGQVMDGVSTNFFGKYKFTVVISLQQQLGKLFPHSTGHGFYRKQKLLDIWKRNPSLTVLRHTATCDDIMNMNMISQTLTPCM